MKEETIESDGPTKKKKQEKSAIFQDVCKTLTFRFESPHQSLYKLDAIWCLGKSPSLYNGVH